MQSWRKRVSHKGDRTGYNRRMSYLREALLLQICYDALAKEVRGADDVQHLLVVVAKQRELEAVLGGIDGDSSRTGRAIEAVNCLSLDAGKVYGVVEGADHTMISVCISSVSIHITENVFIPLRQAILDVIERGIDKDPRVIPSSRFDTDGFVDQGVL